MTENLLLNDRYRLVRLLAVGGMGQVWHATDELLARPVAVKLLRFEHMDDSTARNRFRAEARFAGSLQHGGIAQVYDYGEHDEQVFLVMELVSGEPLSDVLERRGQLSADITLNIVAQAARALQVAHTAGIVHRDIKPGNLMVTDDDIIKITDFGIARDGAVSSYTATGMVMGTAHYVSPEQATAREVTGASDLYSLGVVAYQCLTGELPFDGDTAVAVAMQHVQDAPPPLPTEIPEQVREFIERLLNKDPARRPGSAQDVADEASRIRASIVFGVTRDHPAVPVPESPAAPPAGYSQPAAQAPPSQPTQQVPSAQHAEQQTRGPWEAAGAAAEAKDPWDEGYDDFDDPYVISAGSGRGDRRRGSVVVLTLVGTAILVLGVIMLGSLWPRSNGAKYVEDYRPGPVPSQEVSPEFPGPADGGAQRTPTATPSATPTQRVTRQPVPKVTPQPRPTRPSPRPTRPTPTRTTPDPSDDPTISPPASQPAG